MDFLLAGFLGTPVWTWATFLLIVPAYPAYPMRGGQWREGRGALPRDVSTGRAREHLT